MTEIVKRFDEQTEVNKEFWQELKQLKFSSIAQEDAIHALIGVMPDLDKVSETYLDSMDRVADHISDKHIDVARQEHQRIHGWILAEIARRSGAGEAPP